MHSRNGCGNFLCVKLKLVALVKGEARMKATRDTLVEIVTAEPNKYSQAELGRMLGVSRERVHKLVQKSVMHSDHKC